MDYSDDDSHAAWQQMQEELQRRVEEEHARFRAAHPEYEHCPKHPERGVVDSTVCTLRYCAECVQRHRDNYADGMSVRGSTYEYHGPEIMGADGEYHREQRLTK